MFICLSYAALIKAIEFVPIYLPSPVSGVIGCIFTVFSERHLFISSSIFTEWSLTRRVSHARHQFTIPRKAMSNSRPFSPTDVPTFRH